MTGHRRRLLGVVALAAVLMVPMTAPAGAHTHPTPTELAAPGVVYVEAGARVEVALVEHQRPAPHLTIIPSTSNPVLASASGFVVEPTGAVVTSGAIHALTDDDMERASVYAVNEAFKRRYPGRLNASGDELFDRQRIGSETDPLQQRLEACYPPDHTPNDTGGCHVSVIPTYVVYPHVNDQAKYGQLPAELLAASTSDVAVLRVRGGSGMPTVNVGQSTEGAQALSVLGFTAVPDPKKPAPTIKTHLAEVGSTEFKTKDVKPEEAADNGKLAQGLRNGMLGGPAVAEKGQVIGFLVPEAGSGPPPAQPGRLVDAAAIREVLDKAGIEPHQGTVDTTFERASHNYKNGYFAASIPDLEQTLKLYPGHALATIDLAVAKQNVAQGTPGPTAPATGSPTVTEENGSSFPWAVVLAVVAVVLVLAAVGLFLLRRRRRAAGRGAAAHGVPPSPGSPKSGKPGTTAKPETARSREGRPREPAPGSPSRAATGLRERPKVPSGVSAAGAPVAADRAPGPRGPASRAVPGQRAVDDAGSPGEANVLVPPAAEDSQAFCTYCGAALGPHHRFCGRCGRPTG